ncbi:hypothetical protein ACWIWK_03325 [Helicobacter sp. 23-1048]
MTISKVSLAEGGDIVRVVGKISNYHTFLDFKQELYFYLQAFKNKDKEGKYGMDCEIFRIYFVRSYPLNSYVLGLLAKLKMHDKLELEVVVDSLRAFLFLEEIGLSDLFAVKIKEDEQ